MIILVFNAGSSSLKYKLFDSVDADNMTTLAQGMVEAIGTDHAKLKVDGEFIDVEAPTTEDALKIVIDTIAGPGKPLASMEEVEAIGHRVAHGGAYFNCSTRIDHDVVELIESVSHLAPLHNPGAVSVIEYCHQLIPGRLQIAAFDTAFHQTLAPRNYMYPLPYEFYERYGIRKYGAHGTSHRYIANRTAELLGRPLQDLKIITCHLGNGCSLTAVDHGCSADTSMGFTPLGGLMMGTRCGDIDPAIVTFLMEQEGYTPGEINQIMNRESGLAGISGLSNDLRVVKAATLAGHKRATLAYDMYSNSVKKMIGSYIAVMGGVDAIAFAGGVGEHCERMRRMILSGLEPLGIILDHAANRAESVESIISDDRSRVKILIVPTNEELMIARDTAKLVSGEEL